MKAVFILNYFILLLIALTGCESPLHDNFVDIEKPTETPLRINLNAFSEGDNIIIYQENTAIYYSFETYGKKILKAEFTLGDKQWAANGSEGAFWFSPYQIPNGSYTLKCQLYVASHSGSIADQLGAEAYGGEMTWKVTVAYESEPTIVPEMTSRINNDGYLELTWQKPYFKYREFLNYTVHKRGMLIATIEDVDVTSIVDKSHVLDYGDWYEVKANFTDGTSWFIGYKTLPDQRITLEQVEDVSTIDYCTVRWSNNNDYKCKWNVYVDGELKLKETTETSIKIPPCPFGVRWGNRYVQVEVLTYEEEYRSPSPPSQTIAAGTLGKLIGDNDMHIDYNSSENIIYYSTWGGINSMSLPDLTPIAQDDTYASVGYNNAIIASEKNSKVLAYYPFRLVLYEDSKLTSPQMFPLSLESIVFGVQILNDNRLFYFEKTFPKGIVACIVGVDMKVEKRVTLTGSSLYDNPTLSADGKYAYLDSYNEMIIYKFSPEFDIIEKKVYPAKDTPFNYARFRHGNSSQILVKRANIYTEGTTTLYNSEDMTPILTYNAEFGYIDPKTGYLCLSYAERVEVINMESGKILFTLPIDSYQQIYLMDGILFSNSGYALNINPYLKKQ